MKTSILLILLIALPGAPCARAATNQLESLTLEMAERRQPQLAEARALVDATAGRCQPARQQRAH